MHHLKSVALGLLLGIICIVVFLLLGSFTESGSIGIIAFCVASALSAFLLVREYRSAVWHGPAVINLPMWIILLGPADPGQFQQYFIGLFIALVSSYLGSIASLKLLVIHEGQDSGHIGQSH